MFKYAIVCYTSVAWVQQRPFVYRPHNGLRDCLVTLRSLVRTPSLLLQLFELFALFSRFQAHSSCGVDSSQLLAWLSRRWLLGTSTNFYLHQISISYQEVCARWGQVFLCATACSLSVVVVPLKVKRREMKVKG